MYKTYQWVTQPEAAYLNLQNPPTVDFVLGSSDITRRPDIEPGLISTVDQELQAKGFTLTTANPDFYVTIFGRAKNSDWVSTWQGSAPSVDNVPIIMYPGYDRGQARTYRDGMIVLVFYDAKTRKPAWTGVMAGVLQKRSVDLASVQKDLTQLIKDFS
jgi:hypothetical protein